MTNKTSQQAEKAQKDAQSLLQNRVMSLFVHRERTLPNKRQVDQRRQDFKEIYDAFSLNLAADQAARCSQCGVPFCQDACPLYNNIPDWLMLAASGRWYEAYQCSAATNPFPEICGRICPQDKLCEGDCVIEQSTHGAVTIGAVETYITERAWQEGWVKTPIVRNRHHGSVGVIGSGPAGLAAAYDLARNGINCVVYEAQDRAGGLLIYGIPSFKLEKSIVERRIKLLEELGVRFELNCRIGKDLSFAKCRQQHDAILIATGVYQARSSGCTWPQSHNGMVSALPYLIASNRRTFGDPLDKDLELQTQMRDREVLVIGGGDTAMDCVRTAIRQKAKSVRCIYRRDRDNMPGSQRELVHAQDEGVQFSWLLGPHAYHAASDNRLTLEAQQMLITRAHHLERKNVIPADAPHQNFACDTIIEALGFTPEDLPARFDVPLGVNKQGCVQTTEGGKTSLEGVFAAGDIVRGASLVVWAIRQGLEAAEGIKAHLASSSPSQTDKSYVAL